MWWKRAFIILLSLNVLVFAGGIILLNSFPKETAPTTPPSLATPSAGKASVQVVIGQDAINTYLAYAIRQDATLKKNLRYARIQFASDWTCDFGVNVLDSTVPFHLVLSPLIEQGNLYLQVKQASMGVLPIPNGLLFSILQRVHWPSWIGVDQAHDILQINLTKRPQNPFGVEVLNYSSSQQQLTLQLSMSPNAMLQHAP